jgi:regulator of replication initiation timing
MMLDIDRSQKYLQQLEAELDHTITAHNVLLDDNDQLRVENQVLRNEIKKLRDLLYNRTHHNNIDI